MKPDLILTNIRISGWEGSRYEPAALLIRDRHIVSILRMRQLSACSSAESRRIDLSGACVCPAFTDSHIHLTGFSFARSRLFLDGLSLQAIQEKVKQSADTTIPGEWIRGRGWEINRWASGSFPTREDLDAVCPDRAIALTSKDGHSIWMNSLALKLTGFDDQSKDPPGGRILRDPVSKSITGVFIEAAADMALDRIPPLSETQKFDHIQAGIRHLYKQGIVAVHTFEKKHHFPIIEKVIHEPDSPLRVRFNWDFEGEASLEPPVAIAPEGLIHHGGIKLFADGALGSRTAAVYNEYDDEPGNFGEIVHDRNELAEICLSAAQHQIPSAIHAIGDRAVSNAVYAMEKTVRVHANLTGLRIEHLQLVQPSDLDAFRRLNIAASVQPSHLTSDIPMIERYWKKQTGKLYPYRSLQESGARLLFGSDAPIESPNALLSLSAALTRQTPEGYPEKGFVPYEKMDFNAAMSALTFSPSEFENTRIRRGRLQKGFLADIAVLSKDPASVAPGDIKNLQVLMTILNGRVVYDSEQRVHI